MYSEWSLHLHPVIYRPRMGEMQLAIVPFRNHPSTNINLSALVPLLAQDAVIHPMMGLCLMLPRMESHVDEVRVIITL